MSKLIYGVGRYEKGLYVAVESRKMTKEYACWRYMLRRCYSHEYHARQPTYIGCSVSENFKNFQYFARWCQSQKGFREESYQLDKDILNKGNKLYSEDTCVFVPRDINNVISYSHSTRGELPVGVALNLPCKLYRATIANQKGSKTNIGYFKTVESAFLAYKTVKLARIKHLADHYKDKIDARVYEALIKWDINIKD